MNLPSIKKSWLATLHRNPVKKPQFIQLLTDPKAIDQFTVISALLSTPNICVLLSDRSDCGHTRCFQGVTAWLLQG
jgi:hypothetical protein